MGGEGLVGKFSPPFVSRKNMSFFFPVRFEVPQPPPSPPFSPPLEGPILDYKLCLSYRTFVYSYDW